MTLLFNLAHLHVISTLTDIRKNGKELAESGRMTTFAHIFIFSEEYD